MPRHKQSKKTMRYVQRLTAALLLASSSLTFAGAPAVQEPSSAEEQQTVLMGGVPGGRWKEGLLFEGVRPMPWITSAANWFPGTEVVQPNEMRVTFMGTSPMIRPGQMNTSIYVELGNGDNFVFDPG